MSKDTVLILPLPCIEPKCEGKMLYPYRIKQLENQHKGYCLHPSVISQGYACSACGTKADIDYVGGVFLVNPHKPYLPE